MSASRSARQPVGLKPPPKHAPKRLKSTNDLRMLQRLMTNALVRPLTADSRMQPQWIDGRSMEDVAAGFIKANDRLTAFERLELYNRQYWFRLLDCFYDDNPGLRAVLGEKKFVALAEAYLAKYPSRSFSLRNLCGHLEQFISEEPKWTHPHTTLALDMVRFEWAQTVAFDGSSRPVLDPRKIVQADPMTLRVGIQPYVSLLDLAHAVDEFTIAIKKRGALRGEASQARGDTRQAKKQRRVPLPRRLRTNVFVAVHRHDNMLYYKRLDPAAFLILSALRDGETIAVACERAVLGAKRPPGAAQIQEWFKHWIELEWICSRK